MGTVYLALDTELNRTVALKVLPKEKAENPLLVKRFKSEAQSAAQLKHDNVVTIYEAGQVDGLLYIALEYIEGTDVQQLLDRRGCLPAKRTIEIVKQVARALRHAHKQGIVHRDIKPSNLLIRRDGVVKLTDLGLARSIDDSVETSITRAGTTVGTVDYMAPEQARDSRAADIRSDIYSLGCTWYHMLTGVAPFAEGSLTNKLNAHASQPPPDPRLEKESIPEGIVAIMHRMMAKSPQDRYQTPAKLLKDLENANLIRKAVSVEALAALADDGDAESPRKTSAASTATEASNPTAAPPARTLPPKVQRTSKKRETEPDEESEQHSISLTPLQNVAIAAVAVGFLILLWWISSQFAADLDIPPTRPQPTSVETGQKEPAREQEQEPAREQEVADVEPDVSTPDEASDVGRPEEESAKTAEQVIVQASIGREGEGGQMPAWVAKTIAPGAVFTSPAGSELPTFTVGRDTSGSSQFANLGRALKEIPESGGVVQLVGAGPFPLNPIRLTDRQQVVITGAEGSRPLVVLQPDPAGKAAAWLSVSNGSLVLIGLDLAVKASQFSQDGELALVDVNSGDLVVRNCSVTLLGNRNGRTSAFRLSGSRVWPDRTPAHQSRILLERTFVRGGNLSVLDVDQSATDLFAGNCLFATGNSPIVRLTSSSKSHATDGSDGAPARVLRFLSCSACARRTAFELAPGPDADNPPPTHVLLLNSLFGAEEGAVNTVLVSLANWPQQADRGPNRSLLKNLRWTVRSSLVLGWGELVRFQPNEALNVWDAAGWHQFWKDPVEHAQFQMGPWPETPIANFANLTPRQLDSSTIEVTGVTASGGGRPGCDVSMMVSTPPAKTLMQALAPAKAPSLAGTSKKGRTLKSNTSKPKRKPAKKKKRGITRPNF